MSGNATFSGTTYQARVISFVYAHILAQMRLGWLAPYDDTPIALAGETEGPGDDARIEFGERLDAIEIQAKHGLSAGAKLDEVVDRIVSHSSPGDRMRVVLVVNRDSSKTVTREFAGDLNRLRAGRRDGLKAETKRILERLGGDDTPLQRLFAAVVDVDREQDPEAKFARHLLEQVLEEPGQVTAAMSLFESDASEVCARKLHRTRKDLITLLTEAGIRVRPPPKDERWLRQLDFSKQLLDKRYAMAALVALKQLESALGSTQVESTIRYRLYQQTASAQLQLDRFQHASDTAKQALEFDPSGLSALVIATLAALELGNLEEAKRLAQKALSEHPQTPDAWGLQVHLATASGEPLPQPPSGIAGSTEYRTALVRAAILSAEWLRVLELTAAQIAEAPHNPIPRLRHANALLAVTTGTSSEDLARGGEAERLATAAIDLFDDEAHPLMSHALAIRASARRLLGRNHEADCDLAQAQELDPDDPSVIDQSVRLRIADNDPAAALELLRRPSVEKVPVLLALRAELHAIHNDPAAARRDLEAALSRLSDADDADQVRLQAAAAALALRDKELSERVLTSVGASGQKDAVYGVLRGRLAFLQDNPQQAEAHFQDAANRAPEKRPAILTELGIRLLKRGDTQGGLRVLHEVGAAAMPPGALRDYASALQETGDLHHAQQLVDLLAKRGSLPDWALSLATNIALRQEHTEAAVGHLEELLSRGSQSAHARIVLTRLLLESARTEDAGRHAGELASNQSLSPIQRMQVAQLLQPLGRPEDALKLAFRAFRDAPNDPQIHRAFILLILSRNTPRENVDAVGPDTYVRLRGSKDETLERTIFADPPFDALRGELNLADAQAAGLIDKRVGDSVTIGRVGWNQKQWTIEEITPAVVHAAQDAMAHFEDRFPQEPFFMSGFSVGDLSSVSSLVPLIASIEARKAHTAKVQAIYRESVLPLEFIAKMLGLSASELMGAMTAISPEFGPLMVEWIDAEGQQQSRMSALKAGEVVLTRTALQTAFELQLLEHLTAFTIIAPRSLLQELQNEAKEAERFASEGWHTLTGGPQGIAVHDLPPGHPSLIERAQSIQAQLRWVERSVRVVPRPLATIHPIGSREEDFRDALGHSSADAVALAQHLSSTLYADDLGLRRVVLTTPSARSFSTIALLSSLTERGLLSADERDRLLLTLVSRHYVAVSPSADLLLTGLRSATAIGWKNVEQVFALLGAPSMSATEAARIGVQVLKKLATATVLVIDVERAADFVLNGLLSRWPAPLCAKLVETAASNEFFLLPHHLDVIRRVCAQFSRQSRSL